MSATTTITMLSNGSSNGISNGTGSGKTAVEIVDGHVLLPLGADGAEMKVHARWLRQRCASAASVDPSSRQPWRMLAHPKRKEAASSRAVAAYRVGDDLRVEYSDGHVAELDMVRIRAEHKSFARSGALMAEPVRAAPAPRTWSAKSLELYRADHAELELHRTPERAGAEPCAARAKLLGALLRDGVALVRGVPCTSGEVLRFVRSMVGQVRETHWGVTFDVKCQASSSDDNGHADQAYSSAEIDFHIDNPYRTPVPEFQLLHCISWQQDQGSDDEGVNRLVDGFACAERLRETDPAAFKLLASTPLKWENDAPMTSLQPTLQMSADGVRLERVFFSSKSGGFAPLLPVAELDAFYAAFDKLGALFESDEFVVRNRLTPGDVIIFQNSRVLHARTAFSKAVNRHLQGMYMDIDAVERSHAQLLSQGQGQDQVPTPGPAWTSLSECSAEDMRDMCRQYSADQKENRVQRVLNMLRMQQGKHSELGAPVDLFEHGLQTATRAHAGGESVDVVVAALLHDIGELFVPENHGDVPAAILMPYVEPAVTQMLRQHEIFQGQFYGKSVGLDVSLDKLRAMPEFELTQRFCEKYDEKSFDPNFKSHPISFFQPMVEEVFSREPYWHTPGHAKKGLVTG